MFSNTSLIIFPPSAPQLSLPLMDTQDKNIILHKIKAVFLGILDLLLLVYYGIKHALYYLAKCDPFTKRRIFEGKVLCSTANHAKLGDLPQYIAFKHQPIQVDQQTLTLASHKGFSTDKTQLKPLPYNDGHCFGNVTCFTKLWLETGDIEVLTKEFKDGSSIYGAIYQESYESLYRTFYIPQLYAWMDQIIACYPVVSFSEERTKWAEFSDGRAVVILDALEAYLREGLHPSNVKLIDFLPEWIRENHAKNLCGSYLETVRYVDQKFCQQDLSEYARMEAVFSTASLQIEKKIDVSPIFEEMLKDFAHLEPGAYTLSIPEYSRKGIFTHCHGIGLIVDSSGLCYILDSNIAIGWTTQTELPELMRRIFIEYTEHLQHFKIAEDFFLLKIKSELSIS